MTKRYILLLEMYAKGNVILCEENWTIIALLRPYKLGPEVLVHPKEKYPLDLAIKYKLEDYPVTEERLLNLIAEVNTLGKKGTFGLIVSKMLPMVHQRLSENYLISAGWKYKDKPLGLKKEDLKKFLEMLSDLRKLFETDQNNKTDDWFTFWKEESNLLNLKKEMKSEKVKRPFYFDFSPVKYDFGREDIKSKLETDPHEMLESFFSQYEEEEDLEKLQAKVEQIALQKYERIKRDQETRVKEIQNKAEMNLIQAKLIEMRHEEVQGLISTVVEMVRCGLGNIVRSSIAQGKRQGDELALMVQNIDPGRLKAKLVLTGEPGQSEQIVPIDLSISASRNAQKIYEERKLLIEKESKTKKATREVLKKAKALAEKEIRNQKLRLGVKRLAQRKEQWFEKFYWFVSGGRYLVISARDAQQNESLIKKYAHKRDVVLHAQIQGCAFTVIKDLEAKNLKTLRKLMLWDHLKKEGVLQELQNKFGEDNIEEEKELESERKRWHELISQRVELLQSEVPPFYVLLEAATATLGHSKAWAKKIPVEVYWVFGEQVSKKAPSGLFLPTGSFMVYGKKNFVPVHKMEMGFGLLFRVKGDAAKRERIKKEEQKKSWAKSSLFGNDDSDSKDKNFKFNKYGGNSNEGNGKYWDAIEGMKREIQERKQESEEQNNNNEEDSDDETQNISESKNNEVTESDLKEEKDPLSYLESQTYLELDSKTTRINYKAMAREGQMETALIETKFKKKQKQPTKIKKMTKKERREMKEEAKKKRLEEMKKEENKKLKGKKKMTKKKKAKMKKYLERFGDETEEETRQRMTLMGFGQNYLMNKRKKDFKWNNKEQESENQKNDDAMLIEGPIQINDNQNVKYFLYN